MGNLVEGGLAEFNLLQFNLLHYLSVEKLLQQVFFFFIFPVSLREHKSHLYTISSTSNHFTFELIQVHSWSSKEWSLYSDTFNL